MIGQALLRGCRTRTYRQHKKPDCDACKSRSHAKRARREPDPTPIFERTRIAARQFLQRAHPSPAVISCHLAHVDEDGCGRNSIRYYYQATSA